MASALEIELPRLSVTNLAVLGRGADEDGMSRAMSRNRSSSCGSAGRWKEMDLRLSGNSNGPPDEDSAEVPEDVEGVEGVDVEANEAGRAVSWVGSWTEVDWEALSEVIGCSEVQGTISALTKPVREKSSHRAVTTLDDLDNSTWLLAVRVFHAWVFSMGVVVVLGTGSSELLRRFVGFNSSMTHNKRVVGAEDVVEILYLVASSKLIIWIYSGLAQRAAWLVRDAWETDMFSTYRRTLCFEGVGPGSFLPPRTSIEVTAPEQLQQLYEALGNSSELTEDLVIDRYHLFAGSRLLREECMANVTDISDILIKELPARFVFRGTGRAAAFRGTDDKGFLRAVLDMVLQWVIVVTVDITPFVSATAEHGLGGIGSLEWCSSFAVCLMDACILHVFIFFGASTIVDYIWKWKAYHALTRHVEERDGGPSGSGIGWGAADFQFSPTGDVQKMLLPDNDDQTPVRREDTLEAALGEWNGAKKSQPHQRDESINLCVCIHNLSSRPKCRFKLFVTMLVFLVLLVLLAGVAAPRPLIVLAGVAFMLACCATFSQLTGSRGVQRFRHFVGKAESLWGRWFYVNCSVEPIAELVRSGHSLCICVAVLMAAFLHAFTWDHPNRTYGGFLLALFYLIAVVAVIGFNIAKAWSCIFRPNTLWKMVMASAIVHALTLLFTSTWRHGCSEFLFSSWLIFLSQMGWWRKGTGVAYVWSECLLMFGATLFAVVGVASAMWSSGYDFEWQPMFCKPGDTNCQEFQYPALGEFDRKYNFCSMNWPMARPAEDSNSTSPGVWNTKDGGKDATKLAVTVAEDCDDDHLTLIDFAQMASVVCNLPNIERFDLAMGKYLKGWDVVWTQTHDITVGHRAVFMHIKRGLTHVVAVRGTASLGEFLQDLNFWMPVGFLQLARRVSPSLLSSTSVFEMLAHRTKKKDEADTSISAYNDLLAYMKDKVLKNLGKGEVVYLTGHSLGGGVASFVGGILDLPAITFAAPGMQAATTLLNPQPKERDIVRRQVNVVMDRDIVPMLDTQIGSVLKMNCPLPSAQACHVLAVYQCELQATCGGDGGRSVVRPYAYSCQVCKDAGQDVSSIDECKGV